MRTPWLGLGAGALVVACAAAPAFHEGRTATAANERPVLVGSQGGHRDGFGKFWRNPAMATPGLLKWSQDESWAAQGAPPELLQNIRDELGRANSAFRAGPDLLVTITVYRYTRRWWGPTEVSVELVARDRGGRLAWAADHTVRVSKDMARSAADTDSEIIARELGSRLRYHLPAR